MMLRWTWEAVWRVLALRRMCVRSQPQPRRMGGSRAASQAAGAADCCLPQRAKLWFPALQRVDLPAAQVCAPSPRVQSKQATPPPHRVILTLAGRHVAPGFST